MASGARQHGLTLVEVILVLALLVVIGGVSAPLLEGSFSRAGLQNGADMLRGAWGRARLAAMESGSTHVFRYEIRGSRYLISSFDSLGTAAEPPPENSDVRRDPSDLIRLGQNRLPDGIVFAAGDIAASTQVEALLGQLPAGAWSAPILFHVNGTTSDASLVLANDSENTIRVTLRGLTGISNAGDVDKEPVPTP
jgi:prepilin-type N-terminal cleavage/methylation domain-containing protein